MTKGRPVTREIRFRGKIYPTITAILKEFGFRFGTFSTYRQTKCKDKSLEEALESFLETHRSPNIRIPVSHLKIKGEEIKMRESPLVQTLEVWKSLEPEMTKEAEIIAENLNKVFTYEDGEPLDFNIEDCMSNKHLLSLVPLILYELMPIDDDYENNCTTTLLDIGCSVGFLAPFCERMGIDYVGVDSDTIGREKNKYSEHIRFKQNDPNAHYVRYIEGDIKDIDGAWARKHDINPSETFVVCAYCPPCKADTEISRNLKARLAHEFEKCLIL